MGCQFVFAAEGEEWKGFSVHICRTGHKSLTYTPTHMSEKRTMRLLMACAIGTLAAVLMASADKKAKSKDSPRTVEAKLKEMDRNG
jgi:hypothetical protein